MFDVFRKEVKVGDIVKLFLTTGKEPEGEVLEIGDNFVLLKVKDQSHQRFFDKIIGGWDISDISLYEQLVSKKKEIPKMAEISASNNVKDAQNNLENSALIELLNDILKNTSDEILNTKIGPNAKIIRGENDKFWAKAEGYSEVLILKNRIFSKKILKELSLLQNNLNLKSIPALCSFSGQKREKAVATVAVNPQKVKAILLSIIYILNEGHPESAFRVFQLLRNPNNNLKNINLIRDEFKKLLPQNKLISTEEDAYLSSNKIEEFKLAEIDINRLIQENKYQEALKILDRYLAANLSVKYRSSFLLKKAQTYSSLNEPQKSEEAYQDLINFNEKTGAPSNNISHLYTELGRLQSTDPNKIQIAVKSLKKAIKLNPGNAFAQNLLKKINAKLGDNIISKGEHLGGDDVSGEENLVIDFKEDQNIISELITIDLDEHKYNHPSILSNDGKPTPSIARAILQEAEQTQTGDLSERYPIYLEAAKAYSRLNVGSYDFNEYYKAVAYYSMLKGNSIFINFRNRVNNGDFEIKELSRLKDSACSYFIEALNLISDIHPPSLLSIMNNFLKVNIVYYFVAEDKTQDLVSFFKGNFSDTFDFCIQNKNKEIEKIAYKAIIDCGASSINAWNQLAKLPKGTGRLYYSELIEPEKRISVFNLIIEVEEKNFDLNLPAGQFLKEVFMYRRKKINRFKDEFGHLSREEFTPSNFKEINKKWDGLQKYDNLLLDTDREIKDKINELINRLQPYLNRNQNERTNILIQSRQTIERLLEIIRQHTTYFGRVLYFDLLKNWKGRVDQLLQEKISASYPIIEIIIDPPYLLKKDENYFIPIILKNIGDSTASGYKLSVKADTINFEIGGEDVIESEVELAAGDQTSLSLDVPAELLKKSDAMEANFTVQPFLFDRKLEVTTFNFTLELEPEFQLDYEDIPWKDGPIPSEQMFKGRRKLIRDLAHHYLSVNRDKPYILYGLTRTGKSSVLKYLAEELQGETIRLKGEDRQILVFHWDLSEAASQTSISDFYDYILFQKCYEELNRFLVRTGRPRLVHNFGTRVKFKDFMDLLLLMDDNSLFPIFFVDEFSFIKKLIDRKVISEAFLQSIRQFSLNSLASFIFAGTFDIKELVTNPDYGITGQLVHTIEEEIGEIKPEYSEDLIRVIESKIVFTSEAIERVKFLSGNIPYFIQIICKNCGYLAVENHRKYIGFPELEYVIKVLIGEEMGSDKSLIKKLPEGAFSNNQFNPQDPKEVSALISTIAYINKNNVKPRAISLAELERFWGERELSQFRPRLSGAIMTLKERKIIIVSEDEGLPVYSLAVDLFRRWWAVHHPDITLELNTLKEM